MTAVLAVQTLLLLWTSTELQNCFLNHVTGFIKLTINTHLAPFFRQCFFARVNSRVSDSSREMWTGRHTAGFIVTAAKCFGTGLNEGTRNVA